MLVAVLTFSFFFVSCDREDDPIDAGQQLEKEFQAELDQAIRWAQIYGPPTQALAEEVAARHNGKTTPLDYKTRESAERKCRSRENTTDNCA